MQKIELYRDLNLESINVEGVFGEIQSRKESGYFKIVYWDQEDYIFYAEGVPIFGVSYDRQGYKRPINYASYKPKSRSGTLSFIKLSTLETLVFKYKELQIPTPYNFVSYGTQFLAPVKAIMVEPKTVLEQAKSSYLSGYMIIGDNKAYKSMLFLQSGEVIAVYDSRGFTIGDDAKVLLNPEEDYVGLYSTEPEVSLLISCMDTLQLYEEKSFRDKVEFEKIEKDIVSKKISCLLDANLSKRDRLYQFFYSGVPIVRILHTKEEMLTVDKVDINPNTENTLRIFSMDVIQGTGRVRVEFSYEDGDVNTSVIKELSFVPTETIRKLKEVFVEEIGPIGNLLWNKILQNNRLKESEITKIDFEMLINTLKSEIPDEKHRSIFIEKVRRLRL